MAGPIEIIDPEGQRRMVVQRRLLVLACFACVGLLGLPVARVYASKWRALCAARKLALYLSMVRTQAILKKTPLEARFGSPDLIEVREVTSCGPNARKSVLWTARLADFEEGVEFAQEPWVRQHVASKEPVLQRYCYDPVYGSSVHADGMAHGAIFLVHADDRSENHGEHAVQLVAEGATGDLSLE